MRRAVLSRGTGKVSQLPRDEVEMPMYVHSWMTDRQVEGFVVLKAGTVKFERYSDFSFTNSYLHETTRNELHRAWSVTKSVMSLLFGILRADGLFPSLDESVEKFVPSLSGTAYNGVSLRNVLAMSSGTVLGSKSKGVRFTEEYFDPRSDIKQMLANLSSGGSLDAFALRFKVVWIFSTLAGTSVCAGFAV